MASGVEAMNGEDLSQSINDLVDSLGVEVEICDDILDYGMHMLTLEDPHGVGAPMSLVWPSNGCAVVTIGSAAAREEIPINEPNGIEELLRIIRALLIGGGAVEEGTSRGVRVVVFDANGNRLTEMRTHRGAATMAPDVLGSRRFGTYSRRAEALEP